MTQQATPCELDPVVLRLELDSAWEIAEGYRVQSETSKRIEGKYRHIHRLNTVKVEAFHHIASLISDWEHLRGRRPPEHFLQLIQARVKNANEAARKIAEEAGK